MAKSFSKLFFQILGNHFLAGLKLLASISSGYVRRNHAIEPTETITDRSEAKVLRVQHQGKSVALSSSLVKLSAKLSTTFRQTTKLICERPLPGFSVLLQNLELLGIFPQ